MKHVDDQSSLKITPDINNSCFLEDDRKKKKFRQILLILLTQHINTYIQFSFPSLAGNGLICTLPVKLSSMTLKPVAGHLLNQPFSEALTLIVVVLSGSSPTLIHALKRNGII